MSKMIKNFQLGIVSLSMLAILAACGNGGTTQEDPATTDEAVEEPAAPAEDTTTDDSANQDPATQDPGTVDTSNGLSNVEFPIALEQAIQMFNDTFGEGINLDEIEFDEENGVYEYHISGWDNQNEYDIEIDAETGEIVEQEKDREADEEEDMIDVNSIIPPQAAMDIATEATGTDFIESWSIEVDDGVTVYEIDTAGADDDDITINAETGDVVDR